MVRARKLLFLGVVVCACGIFVFGGGTAAETLNIPDAGVSDDQEGDDAPGVVARVARISFIRGEARIRRSGVEEWEKAVLNLPVTEGDEITTEAGGRLELQFDKDSHLRLSENAYLRVTGLKDEGIAVSLSLGTLNLRVTSFDKDRSYFEIDAPKTTLALQKAGNYRVDAGVEGDPSVRVTATAGGEARVYSDSAGFVLKNGRSSTIYIDGPKSGELETAQASELADEFDDWTAERDQVIAKRLKDAYYDKYYDNDIYGADDLNDYGDWVHTRTYGYVWRPYAASLAQYADWSPYRYGHWRWMPLYGWVWVNDEPWGWATYHHGRWVFDDGHWYWSPYGYYRTSHSWWYPSLVVITIYNNNVCWYPLPYHRRWRDHHGPHHPGHGGPHHAGPPLATGGIKPIPPATPPSGGIKQIPPVATTADGTGGVKPPRVDIVPPNAVVAIGADDFGTGLGGVKPAPMTIARSVLATRPEDVRVTVLPPYSAVRTKIGGAIRTERPPANVVAIKTTVGAGVRKANVPLDTELRNTRVFGGRPPVKTSIEAGVGGTVVAAPQGPRQTGAVERPPVVVRQTPDDAPIRQPPIRTPPGRTKGEATADVPAGTPQSPPPVKQPPRVVRDEPSSDQTPVRQPPREPAPTKPPPRSDAPPAKAEPKPDIKPSRSPEATVQRKEKG